MQTKGEILSIGLVAAEIGPEEAQHRSSSRESGLAGECWFSA